MLVGMLAHGWELFKRIARCVLKMSAVKRSGSICSGIDFGPPCTKVVVAQI